MTFYNTFENWSDVQREFKTDYVPEQVLYANYDIDGYDGTALVVFREENKYGVVYGSHCSCYGLEDQWDVEWYTKDELLAVIHRKMPYRFEDHAEEIVAKLKKRKNGRVA